MQGREKSVRYKLTRVDLFAFTVRGVLRNRILMGFIVLMQIFVIRNEFVSIRSDNARAISMTGATVVAIITGIITLIIGAFIGAALILLMTLTAKKAKGTLEKCLLTISEDGLATKSDTSETLRKWTAIYRIASTRKYLLIYWNESLALVIPKRAFASRAEAAEFEKDIRTQMLPG